MSLVLLAKENPTPKGSINNKLANLSAEVGFGASVRFGCKVKGPSPPKFK